MIEVTLVQAKSNYVDSFEDHEDKENDLCFLRKLI